MFRSRLTTVLCAQTLVLAGAYVGARGVAVRISSVPPPQMQAPPRDNGPTKIPVGTALISGVVVSSTGRPIAKARVSLHSTEPGAPQGAAIGLSRSVATDAQGQFSFAQLPAGGFTLSASKAHFLTASYGQKKPERPGTAIQLRDGQQFKEATLRLWSMGAITGTVLDEEGEPAMNARVRAMRYMVRNGVRQLTLANEVQTDDRGVYRLFNLSPGDYVISAVSNNQDTAISDTSAAAIERAIVAVARTSTTVVTIEPGARQELSGASYAPTFYPGTLTPNSGSTVTLASEEERSGVDFQLMLTPTVQVQGLVVSSTGTLPPNLNVQMTNADEGLASMGPAAVRVTQDGRFSFRNVAPGQYTVSARAAATGGRGVAPATPPTAPGLSTPASAAAASPVLFGRTTITVGDAPVANITVTLDTGRTVSGRVTFVGATKPPDLGSMTGVRSMNGTVRMTATLSPVVAPGLASTATPSVPINPDGHFSMSGVMPGRYILRVSGAPGWFLKSSVVNGQDSLDFPIVVSDQDILNAVVTFTDKSTELTGLLQDGRGQPAADYTVVVFAVDSRFWTPNSRRIQQTRPATDGRFTLRDLAPGDYFVAAITDLDPGALHDPELLRQLAAASTRVSLGEGEKKTQDLRLTK